MRSQRPAPCHPERVHYAKELCSGCYWAAKRAARPKHPRVPMTTTCHPDQPHHCQGLCRPCYRRKLYYEAQRPAMIDQVHQHGGVVRGDWTPLPPADLKAWRQAHGWSSRQLGTALGYAHAAWSNWETGRAQCPPDAVAYVAAHPAPAIPARRVPPTPGILRQLLERKGLRILELADFCGVAESTVTRWLGGARPIPLPVQAWIRAGGPPAWRWAPEGQENVISTRGRHVGHRPRLRQPGRLHALPLLRPRLQTPGRAEVVA